MPTEIRVPTLGESVAEATVGRWLVEAGATVAVDEPVVELETDKVSIEVPAPTAGTLAERTVAEGETVEVGALLGVIGEAGDAPGEKPGTADSDAQGGSSSEGVSGGDAAPRSAAPIDKPVAREVRGTDDGAMERRGAVDTGAVDKGAVDATDDAPAANGETVPAAKGNTSASADDGTDGSDDRSSEQIPQTSDAREAQETPMANLVTVDVPSAGESVTEAEVGAIFKRVGDTVAVDEPILELETDKAAQDVMSPVAGVITELAAATGDVVEVGQKLVVIDEGASGSGADEVPAGQGEVRTDPTDGRETPGAEGAPQADEPRAASQSAYGNAGAGAHNNAALEDAKPQTSMPPSPSAQRMMTENEVKASDVEGSGRRGQVLKGDVMSALDRIEKASVLDTPKPAPKPDSSGSAPSAKPSSGEAEPRTERVRMTRLRQTIARRLKEAQDTAAMLTTFNEVDMGAVMEMRTKYKELFERKHGVKLGFMGFFTKAVTHALKEIPAVNAEIDGTDIVYKDFAHIGVAVGTDKGLVVPVVRDADAMSIAEVEKEIGRLGRAARDGELSMSDMQGGTFTISNGGVYGSLMSTPILNAPQSGILGMHKIQQRPMAIDGKVEIRPMMYLALSYDHRIVDGKEAVTFLVRVKESLEDPERLVLDL